MRSQLTHLSLLLLVLTAGCGAAESNPASGNGSRGGSSSVGRGGGAAMTVGRGAGEATTAGSPGSTLSQGGGPGLASGQPGAGAVSSGVAGGPAGAPGGTAAAGKAGSVGAAGEKGGAINGGNAGTATAGKAGTTGGAGAKGGTQNGGAAGAASAGKGGAASGGSAGNDYILDCGANGWAVESHGPPANRVNYVIIGDGYQAADLAAGGTFEQHINKAMAKRFSIPIGEPYSRYRKFVNICAVKLPSTAAICNGSPLGCCGDDTSRLADCNTTAVNQALTSNLPTSFVVDWKAVVLNGKSWWNTGSALMLWSGGHADAAGAALHEGGHGFHQLADEYTGSGSGCSSEYAEVNSTANSTTTTGKWDLWLNYNQVGATGLQTTLAGSRYCTAGQYRPSNNSMMNMLFGNNPDTSYNAVSREQIIFNIWRAVVPIDSTTPPSGPVSNPAQLAVKVIDPTVIDVDWSVDGTVVAPKGGESLDVAARGLASGTHTITARAYDNASEDWVRYRSGACPASVTGGYCSRTAWPRSQQTVTWTVTIP